jgi:hypothetical protein
MYRKLKNVGCKYMCWKIFKEETVRRKSFSLEDNIKRNLQDRNVGRNKAAQEKCGGRVNVKERDFK